MTRQGLALSCVFAGGLTVAAAADALAQSAAASDPQQQQLLRISCDSVRAQVKAPDARQIRYSLFEAPPGAPIGWGAMYPQDQLTWYAQSCPLTQDEVNKLRVALGLPRIDAPVMQPSPPVAQLPVAPPPTAAVPPTTPPTTPPPIVQQPVAPPPVELIKPWNSREALLSSQLPPGVAGTAYQRMGTRVAVQLKTDRDWSYNPAVPLAPDEAVEVFESRRPSDGATGSVPASPVVSRKYVVRQRAGIERRVRVVIYALSGNVSSITDHDLKAGTMKIVRGAAPR